MTTPHENEAKRHLAVVGKGQIGTPLVHELVRQGHRVTWISRSRPNVVPEGVTHYAIDASDGPALARAIGDVQALIAAVNPSVYDAEVWRATLPPIQRGLIEAASLRGARLVLLDALYLYTTREGPLAPTTRQAPETEKGKIRKELSDMLVEAQKAGKVRACVLRASDFWGPELTAALLTHDGLRALARGKGPMLLGNPDVPHAFTHRDDVVRGLITLALAPNDVEGQVFHAPVIHVEARKMVEELATAFHVRAKPFVTPRWLLRIAGLFSKSTRGLIEMLPQWEAPYLVDDSAYCQRFQTRAVTLAEGVRDLAERYAAHKARAELSGAQSR